jgi:hypothetical protein
MQRCKAHSAVFSVRKGLSGFLALPRARSVRDCTNSSPLSRQMLTWRVFRA